MFFSSNNNFKWLDLDSAHSFKQLKEEAKDRTVIVFKHSTRCGISSSVKSRFEKNWSENSSLKLYLLDLIANRDLSNSIATEFGVEHQSPQIIVLNKGKVLYHASHYDINADEITDLLSSKQV